MKKVISFFLAVAVLIAILPLAAIASAPVLSQLPIAFSGGIRFIDLTEAHWAYKDIMALTNMGALNGYEDGTFRPDSNLTLGEMAKIVSETFVLGNPPGWVFDPNKSEYLYEEEDAWYASYAIDIYWYYHSGTDGMGNFYGIGLARRRDVAHVLVNVLNTDYQFDFSTANYNVPDNFADLLGNKFTDMHDLTYEDAYLSWDHPWLYDDPSYMYVASELGIITGYSDGTFRPFDNITRAEFCTMVNRALAMRGN
ncbi:MAG: S-layer homology domain-containing protein [Oscillospiraceae bacterium]|nr:S-layer homology domain-containing protein [Oscillospiraceae bacterium]